MMHKDVRETFKSLEMKLKRQELIQINLSSLMRIVTSMLSTSLTENFQDWSKNTLMKYSDHKGMMKNQKLF